MTIAGNYLIDITVAVILYIMGVALPLNNSSRAVQVVYSVFVTILWKSKLQQCVSSTGAAFNVKLITTISTLK